MLESSTYSLRSTSHHQSAARRELRSCNSRFLPFTGCSSGISQPTAAACLAVAVTAQRWRARMSPTAKAAHQAANGPAGKQTSVLFVCLGNICRSPTAEAMFKSVVQKAGVADRYDIDSCGTGGGSPNWYQPGGFSYHEGDASDPRMTAAAVKRGVRLTSRSRPLIPADLHRFDYIVGMDPTNIRAILRAASYWSDHDKQLPDLDEVCAKTSLMTTYCTRFKAADEVPDPYYGGPAGFDTVLDLLDDASTGLLAHIEQQQQASMAVAEEA